MATTFFPYNPSHIWSAAGWVVNAVLDTNLSLETTAALNKRALAPAERLRAARDTKSSLQGAHKAALVVLNETNTKNDAAGSAVVASAGMKGGRELQEKVQVLLGGRRMSDVTSAPHEEEIRTFWDFFTASTPIPTSLASPPTVSRRCVRQTPPMRPPTSPSAPPTRPCARRRSSTTTPRTSSSAATAPPCA